MGAIQSFPTVGLDTRAPILEVFASLQGEGRFLGEPQVFLRLYGCPLRCRWCDTPGSWALPSEAKARLALPGGVGREPGWATPFQAATWIASVEPGSPRTISVTGGEPLLWPGFVLALRGFVGARRIHLETAGAHPEALAQVLEAVDHVSLDLKLPADLEAPVPIAGASESVPATAEAWARTRRRVLEMVRGRDACAKLILSGGQGSGAQRAEAYRPLLDDVAELAPELPVFLQPVTPLNGVPAPSPELLEEVVELALERGLETRVVPQVHRLLGVP